MIKNNRKRKSSISLIISIALLLGLIVVATYAIVGAIVSYDDSNIIAQVGSRPVFVSDTSDQISLDIQYVLEEVDSTYLLASDTGTVNISLSTNNNFPTLCHYDLVWQWDETSDVEAQYKKTPGADIEYTIEGAISTIQSFEEVQLSDYSDENRNTYLYTGSIVNSGNGKITYQTWDITANFYKTPMVQTAHKGASYSGKIVVENVRCEKDPTLLDESVLSNHILALASSKNYISSQDGETIYRVKNDNGIRYEGTDPDNYVIFSDLPWRIIGAFDGADIGLESGKYYTKLVLTPYSDSFYGYFDAGELDNQSGNAWETSDIRYTLNEEFYKEQVLDEYDMPYGIADDYRHMIANATWYLGGMSSDYINYKAQDAYMAERGLIGATDSPNTLSIKDYVGLMYPSDYFYGRYNTNCDSNTFSNLPIEIVVGIMSGEVSDTFTEEQLICLESNWTLDVSQYDFNGGTDLLMTSPSEFVEATLLAAILNGGQITEMSKEQYEQMYQTFGPPTFIGVMGILITPMPSGLGLLMRDSMFYRPTIYLESDVLIESGDGSMENPYIISPQ